MPGHRLHNHNMRLIKAQTERQEEYIKAIESNDVVFGIGCAGTGKTFVALGVACKMLEDRFIDQIVVTRPTVSSAHTDLGYFKGTKEEKVAEWMRPAISALNRFLGVQKVNNYVVSGKILMEPLGTMRGETFDNAFVLLDEAQNTTIYDLEMFLTRIGQNSKIVINGDTEQTDLSHHSGLSETVYLVRSKTSYPVIEFDLDDVVRSEVCKRFIKIFREHWSINPR